MSQSENCGHLLSLSAVQCTPTGSSQEKALVFSEITLQLPSKGKTLIESVTGKATAGRVLALMGPSGVWLQYTQGLLMCMHHAVGSGPRKKKVPVRSRGSSTRV